jgi:hypothetical protein
LKIIFEIIPGFKNFTAPSPTTIKRWTQKVGYYKLMLPKVIAHDWMIVIDASIQMGEKKCVLVVGCRQADFPMNRALMLKDLTILNLRIVSSLNAEVVTDILHEVALDVGKITCICSDRGSEMIRGIKNFQINNPETCSISDTAHRVANLLEATLEKSKKWKEFREEITQARRRMQNSLVPGLLPPSPRTKARYMNVDSLIEWALDMLLLFDNTDSLPEMEMKELQKYLGWLQGYREDVVYWNRLVSIGLVARELVREEGIHIHIADTFEQRISNINMGFRELQFANELVIFLLGQSRVLKPGERFVGSSEVLESLFGKIKYMEYEQTAFGFTSLVLAAIAHVGSPDDEIIKKAITDVKMSNIDEWTEREIGRSVQSQRRQMKKIITELRMKVGREFTGALEKKVMGF